MRRLTLAAVAVALLAGCGGAAAGGGHATLWVTRDEGATLVLDRRVPAGETALQALDREADITTRYGGKFVQSVDGVAGSVATRHDWFYFVNGIEAARGAQEYRLHDGDVLWWDYRDWGRYGQNVSAVVGAFPEPFLHGYGGKVPRSFVSGATTKAERRVMHMLHATASATVPADANTLVFRPGAHTSFTATAQDGRAHFVFTGDPSRLLDHSFYLRKYRVR